jgi:hypothetical protein
MIGGQPAFVSVPDRSSSGIGSDSKVEQRDEPVLQGPGPPPPRAFSRPLSMLLKRSSVLDAMRMRLKMMAGYWPAIIGS